MTPPALQMVACPVGVMVGFGGIGFTVTVVAGEGLLPLAVTV